MFGFGMFDEPSPDTTEILERDDYISSETTTPLKDYSSHPESYSNTYQNSRPSYQIAVKILTEEENIESLLQKS